MRYWCALMLAVVLLTAFFQYHPLYVEVLGIHEHGALDGANDGLVAEDDDRTVAADTCGRGWKHFWFLLLTRPCLSKTPFADSC